MDGGNDPGHPAEGDGVTNERKPDALDQAFKGIGPKRLHAATAKESVLSIRLSADDHASMKKTAKMLQLTVTAYLETLHRLAVARLDPKMGERGERGDGCSSK